MTEEPRLGWQFRWQTFSNLGTAAIQAGYVLFLGRALGLEAFGAFAIATAVATFAFGLLDFRLQEVVVHFLEASKEPQSRPAVIRLALWIDSGSRLFAWVAILIASPSLTAWFELDSRLSTLFVLGATAALGAKLANSTAVGVLRFSRHIDWLARVILAGAFTKLCLTWLAIAYVGPDIVWVLIVGGAVDTAANVVTCFKASRVAYLHGMPPGQGDVAALQNQKREIARFLAASCGISVSDSFLKELDTTLVGLFLSLQVVALYRMAKSIVLLGWRGVDAVYIVVMPIFARLIARNANREISELALKLTIMSFVVCAVGFLLAIPLLPQIIPMVLGDDFADAAPAAQLMMVGLVLGAPLIWTHAYWIGAGKPHIQLIANTASAGVSVAAFLFLTPVYGLLGASVAFALALCGQFVLSWLAWLRRR